MPTHVTDVKKYYEEMIYMVTLPKYWQSDDLELHEFLDCGTAAVSETPPEFADFQEAYASVRDAALKLDLYENLSTRHLRTLARGLFASYSRQKYYLQFLNDYRRRAGEVGLVSFIEVEQRYQYYLYRKERKHRGLGQGPKFETWLAEGSCITFYDILS